MSAQNLILLALQNLILSLAGGDIPAPVTRRHRKEKIMKELEVAIEYLNAIQVDQLTYAYLPEEDSPLRRVGVDEMIYLGRLLAADVPDAFSRWCSACGIPAL